MKCIPQQIISLSKSPKLDPKKYLFCFITFFFVLFHSHNLGMIWLRCYLNLTELSLNKGLKVARVESLYILGIRGFFLAFMLLN